MQDSHKSILPPTDARVRPDIRKLEEGDIGKYHKLSIGLDLQT